MPLYVPAPGGSAYSVVKSWTYSTNVPNVDLADLSGVQDMLILARDITTDASTFRGILFSVNNGSTFLSTTGDYKISAGITGAFSDGGDAAYHSTNTTAARSLIVHIPNAGHNGSPKYVFTNGALQTIFTASTSPINAIRLRTGTGNITGGSIQILGR